MKTLLITSIYTKLYGTDLGGRTSRDHHYKWSLLNILNTKKTSPEKKMWAAERAAPYVHSRLSSVNSTISGDDDKPVAVTIGWRKKKRD